MSLPVPNLDDRRFQDLVDEAKRMIPSLTPEWTNHNVADPGVALIELFAWMSEQVIYRLNQVPDRLYVDFLNLLGMAPFPAAAARTDLTFSLAGVTDQAVTVPAGTEVTTADADGVIFTTLDDLTVTQPAVVAALTGTGERRFDDVSDALRYDRDAVTCFASVPVTAGDAFYLGSDVSLASQLVELQVQTVEVGVGVDPSAAPIVWEVWSGEHWIAARVLSDTTGGLNRSGAVRLIVPAAHEPLAIAGQRHHWLRVRLLEVEAGEPTYRSSPTLQDVRMVSLGGNVQAEHSRPIATEQLGTSDGTPDQAFELDHRPVLPRRDGEHVIVTVGAETHAYTEVDDFSVSGPADRHVRFDGAAGVVHFGPRIRYPDGSSVQHGHVPPFGAQVAITRYRTGGGSIGNVDAGRLTALRTSIPYIRGVVNHDPARGGVAPETVDEVKLRAPRTLRTGQRAVTPTDYEQLTLEASPQVARAACLPPASPLEPIRVLVVPASDRNPGSFALDDFALTPELFRTIRDHLDERRTLGALVEVTAPYYQGVSVVVRLRAATGRSLEAVKERVAATIARFLSPLDGGQYGQGWPFDTDLSGATLVSVIEEVVGVAGVDELTLFEYDLRNAQRLGDARDHIALDEASLFLCGKNQVVVR